MGRWPGNSRYGGLTSENRGYREFNPTREASIWLCITSRTIQHPLTYLLTTCLDNEWLSSSSWLSGWGRSRPWTGSLRIYKHTRSNRKYG